MAFQDMIAEIRGSVPKMPRDYAKTLVNRAWTDLRRKNLWSFLIYEGNWVAPAPVVGGLLTATQGSNTVTLNSAGAAAFNASITSVTPAIARQLRVGLSTIYNIWAWDTVSTITLDRPYQEVSTTLTSGYNIYQPYYAAPVSDFWAFISVRDFVNFIDLYTDRYTRADLDEMDPQRTWYYFPTDVVPYQLNQNLASPTYQSMMYELWGAPQSNLVYQVIGLRKGLPLVNPTDTLPPQVGEDCVTALARMYAYEWAEANKGDTPRNQGSDWKYLIGQAGADYKRLYKEYRMADREIVDNFFANRRSTLYGKFYAEYNTMTMTAYPGAIF
jgi:hypothetical protein